jgi:hypothetical protein
MDMRCSSPSRRWLQRLVWLAALWFVGVAGMGLVTLLLRALMRAAGLSS